MMMTRIILDDNQQKNIKFENFRFCFWNLCSLRLSREMSRSGVYAYDYLCDLCENEINIIILF